MTQNPHHRSIFADYARKLRDEREASEAQTRMEADAEAQAATLDPLLIPSPPPDAYTITSFGEAIPLAPEEKPKLKYSDSPYAPDWAKHPSQRKPPPPIPGDEPFRPSVEWFEDLLWQGTSDDVRAYCIMDGYWAKGLYGRLLASPDVSWAHMFQGDVALQNIQDAPFIIALKRGHKILRWLIEEGWGDGWGIYFTASTKGALDRYGKTKRLPNDMTPSNEEQIKLCNLAEGMEDPLWLMRRHFRRFSDVEFEDDARIVDFRYYDPAALRTYLPSCNDKELFRFTGPAKYFYAEGYCELESLNCRRELYRFKVSADYSTSCETQPLADGQPMVFEGKCYDMEAKTLRSVPRFPISQAKLDRESGLYPMIRTGQLDIFRRHQQQLSINELADALQITKIGNFRNREESLGAIRKCVELYGMPESKHELIALFIDRFLHMEYREI